MRSLLRTKYFQFLEHWRQTGFWSACKTTLYKSEELVPTQRDLDSLPSVTLPKGENLQILDLGEADYYSQNLSYPLRSRRERAENYFRRGYRTFVLVQDGRVLCDLWYVTRATGRIPFLHPHVKWFGLNLADDEVYLFDMQMEVGQRGAGLSTAFHGRVLQMLRDRGFRKAYGCYVAKYIPALWMHRLIGYQELPHCQVRRFFLFANGKVKN